MDQLPAIILISPLLAAFFVVIAGWLNHGFSFWFSTVSLAISVGAACLLLCRVLDIGPVHYYLGSWAPPVGIELAVDGLNAVLTLVISAIALANLLASSRIIRKEYGEKEALFYGIYLLSVAGHIGMLLTGDAFNLYVLLEISALSGYALLAVGSDKAPFSVFRYLMIGTVGASFYLLGIGYLYIMTGSLNMADLAVLLPAVRTSPVVLTAFAMILTGLMIKMAVFPMHAWLPPAYADAKSPAATLIAPMTTKVMVYVMVRMVLSVFTPEMAFSVSLVREIMIGLAIAAIAYGAVSALAQRDLRRMLTYILLAEVGYMLGGFWLGNRSGMTGAMLHIINDALMTFCVFLAASSIHEQKHSLGFSGFSGLFAEMPFTMAALVIGGFSMIGVPPTCGFFSKWYLLQGAMSAGRYLFAGALICSSLVNIVLFFRIFEIAYFHPFDGREHHDLHGEVHRKEGIIRESSWNMLAILLLAGGSLIGAGLISGDIVTHIIDVAFF